MAQQGTNIYGSHSFMRSYTGVLRMRASRAAGRLLWTRYDDKRHHRRTQTCTGDGIDFPAMSELRCAQAKEVPSKHNSTKPPASSSQRNYVRHVPRNYHALNLFGVAGCFWPGFIWTGFGLKGGGWQMEHSGWSGIGAHS